MDIENGVAIVTGSSSGVGAACARQLAERGCPRGHQLGGLSKQDFLDIYAVNAVGARLMTHAIAATKRGGDGSVVQRGLQRDCDRRSTG